MLAVQLAGSVVLALAREVRCQDGPLVGFRHRTPPRKCMHVLAILQHCIAPDFQHYACPRPHGGQIGAMTYEARLRGSRVLCCVIFKAARKNCKRASSRSRNTPGHRQHRSCPSAAQAPRAVRGWHMGLHMLQLLSASVMRAGPPRHLAVLHASELCVCHSSAATLLWSQALDETVGCTPVAEVSSILP